MDSWGKEFNICLALGHFRGIHSTCQHRGPPKVHSWGCAGQLPGILDPKRQTSEHRSEQEAKPHETIPAFCLPPDTIWVSSELSTTGLKIIPSKIRAKKGQTAQTCGFPAHIIVKCKKEQDRQRKRLTAEHHLLCC